MRSCLKPKISGAHSVVGERPMAEVAGNRYARHIYSKEFSALRFLLRARSSLQDYSEALSALGSAASDNQFDAVQVFLDEGVDLNVQDTSGMTPLVWAAYGGRLEMAKCLVGAGAVVDVPDFENMTPLHHAAFKGHLDVVKFLVEAGADVALRNCEGKTALDLARLKPFSTGSKSLIGEIHGVRPRLWDGPVAKYLRQWPRSRPSAS
jgi:ankyrin repeat protein